MLKLASAIGARLVRFFDALGKSGWAQALANQLRERLGVRLSGTRIALYSAALALTLVLLPIGLLIGSVFEKPSSSSFDERLSLLSRLPTRLIGHLTCSRDVELNCLRDPTQFREMIVTSLVGEPAEYLSLRRMSRVEAIHARWAFAASETGRTCARHRSELIFDAPSQDQPAGTLSSTIAGEPPPPGGSDPFLFLSDGDWGHERGEALKQLARTLDEVAADRRVVSLATEPVPIETLKFLKPDMIESFLRGMKGLPPMSPLRREIAAAARFQIDRQKHEVDAALTVDASLKAASLADAPIASALRSSATPTAANASEQYERFVLALLNAPEDKVHVQNVALGLVLASYDMTVRLTIERHLMEMRTHLLELGRNLDTAFGKTATVAVKNDIFDVELLRSPAARRLLSDLGPFRIPRIELCTETFTGLPLGIDRALGIPAGLAALASGTLWYPVNAAVATWQEALSILRTDPLTGAALIFLAGLSLWLAIRVQLEGVVSLPMRLGGVAVAILLFPVYLGMVVWLVGMAYSYITAATSWVLGVMAIPVVSLFVVLFPKVVTAVTLVPTTVRTLVAKSKAA